MISPATIALVKERTDIVALIGETVRLKRAGRSFSGLCPFHKEKSPSFSVSAERGFFHCFGCKESGSAVDFVMKVEGLSFPEAIRSLADRAGIVIEETEGDREHKEAQAERRAKEDLYQVNNLAATFFEHCLRGGATAPQGQPHPLAKYAADELLRRGISIAGDATSPMLDALQAFRIGYAPHAWDALGNFFKQQGISPIAAEKVGLVVPRSSGGGGHYDRFRHRLMFAVTDVMGRVVAFSGRALTEPEVDELRALGLQPPKEGSDKPAKYMNSPESPIYTKGEHLFGLHQARHAIRQEGEAVLVEGNFDVFSLHARGIENVVAPLGTAFTAQQAKLLKRFAPAVTVLFDADAAGRKATRASRGACKEGGLEAKVASLPEGKDPDELVRVQGKEGLERALKAAKGMLEHLIDEALEGDAFGGSSITEQIARVKAVAELLREEDDPALRGLAKSYADRLSSKLIVQGRAPSDLHQLETIMEQAVSARRASPKGRIEEPAAAPEPRRATRPAATSRDRARSREMTEEMHLEVLGALLDFPELLDDPEVDEALDVLEDADVLFVMALRGAGSASREVVGSPDRKSAINTDDFLAKCPHSIHSFAIQRLAKPEHESVTEARSALLDNARKLRVLGLKREGAHVAEQIQKVEARGDDAAALEALREVQRLARAKRGLV